MSASFRTKTSLSPLPRAIRVGARHSYEIVALPGITRTAEDKSDAAVTVPFLAEAVEIFCWSKRPSAMTRARFAFISLGEVPKVEGQTATAAWLRSRV